MELASGVGLGGGRVSHTLSLELDMVAGTRILVVDDDTDILEFLQESLTAAGYEVDAASSAGDALELIRADTYDVAVLDLHLPDMDGVMLHCRIRRMDPELAAWTIFISDLVQSNSNLSYCASQGAIFLSKPFQLGDLLTAIRRLLGKRSELAEANP